MLSSVVMIGHCLQVLSHQWPAFLNQHRAGSSEPPTKGADSLLASSHSKKSSIVAQL